MKFNRTKNASRNIIFGIIQRVYQLVVPFAMRTVMIYLLGVQYLGLDGLFTSILSVLNLAELGVGSAMVYSMYKPIAEDDRTTIGALMNMYKIYYRIIGFIVLIGGGILCPFVPRLISGSVPDGVSIYILFLLNLGATVLSYWLFAYKNCLLQAYQRADVVSIVTMIVNTIRYVLQFLVLFIFHDYYIYLIITLVSQAAINIATALVTDKMFPDLKAQGELPAEAKKNINHKIRDLFTAKVGAVVVNSVDTLVISAFLGLTILAIYQNYYYIITALLSVVNILIYSCTAGIGNSLVVETKGKNYKDLKTFTFIVAGVASFCTSGLLCLYQPFMELWVGKELMFEFPAVVCFCVYFFIVEINTLLNMYKDAAGIWHEDRFRPLVTAVVNLTLNLCLVQYMGIYGILLSTVLSMLIVGMPWLLQNLFTVLFDKKELKNYLLQLIKYAVSAVVTACISYLVGDVVPFSGVMLLVFRIIICAIITILVFYIIYRKTDEFERGIMIVDGITKGKFQLRRLIIKK